MRGSSGISSRREFLKTSVAATCSVGGVSLDLVGQTFSLSRALCAAHFKDIGEIRIELKEE